MTETQDIPCGRNPGATQPSPALDPGAGQGPVPTAQGASAWRGRSRGLGSAGGERSAHGRGVERLLFWPRGRPLWGPPPACPPRRVRPARAPPARFRVTCFLRLAL